MFWDPEPTNDPTIDQPVWCLGRSYKLISPSSPDHDNHKHRTTREAKSDESMTETTKTTGLPVTSSTSPKLGVVKPNPALPANPPQTPPESASSSFSSSLAFEEPDSQSGWPQAFVEDFDSRFWMTYRSQFKAIPRSTDPKAASALSFSMRIKSQLGDQAGFSSDSGWGCMIRSGQSLLANAMGMVRLGRGTIHVGNSKG